MKNRNKPEIKIHSSILVLGLILIMASCSQNTNRDKGKTSGEFSANNQTTEKSYKVTFIELGSVGCIPCRQMQSVMESIESRYGNEVKIEFHDVWTESGKPFGVKYGIESIPTQVFLDQTGKEYFRHVGYFPEEELVKVLQQKGVKLN